MCRPARRRAWSVPVFAFVISFSTNGRSSLAFASVVSIAPCSISDVARFRISAIFCSLVRRSCRPAFLWRIGLLLLFVVGCRCGGVAGRRAVVDDPHAFAVVLVPHPEVQPFLLEQVGDLLKRFLAEVLDLEN